MKLKASDLLYRFLPGYVTSWGERAQREQDALDNLRTHPGFAQLQDVLDSEERAIFRKWRELPAGDPAIVDLHAEAKAFLRLTDVIHRSVNAKVTAEEAEKEIARQIELQKVDKERTADAQLRMARFHQQSRNGAVPRMAGT